SGAARPAGAPATWPSPGSPRRDAWCAATSRTRRAGETTAPSASIAGLRERRATGERMISWRSARAAVAAAGVVGLMSATALAQEPAPTTPAPAPGVIAPGVSIADVGVGGLSQAAARQAV